MLRDPYLHLENLAQQVLNANRDAAERIEGLMEILETRQTMELVEMKIRFQVMLDVVRETA